MTPEEIQRQQRRWDAMRLRESGASYQQIAAQMQIDVHTIYRWVSEAFDELHLKVLESAENVRLMELARLDTMYMRLNLRADKDSPRVVDSMLRIMERRAKMLGLDAPAPQGPSQMPTGLESTEDVRAMILGRLDEIRRVGLLTAGGAAPEGAIVVESQGQGEEQVHAAPAATDAPTLE